MIRNYLKIALRHVRRSKGISLITISGLVLGLASFAMIMQYVLYETSYDKFQSTSENIYRVAFSAKGKDREPVSYATTFLPIASIIKDEFPEVADFNRILYLDRHAVVTYRDKVFQQDNVIYADASFFTFFDYPLVQGDAASVLSQPNTVVISESLSRKYFGEANPIGQFMKLNEEFNELNLLVTGVHKDIPANTHLKPRMVVSLKTVETLPATVENIWSWPIYLNYIRLHAGTDPVSLESKLPALANQHVQKGDGREYTFFLQPLPGIHLTSHLEYEIEENGNATMVYLLMVAAMLIMVIAYVNHINLTSAQSLSRAKEVGMRKVLGSRKGQLVWQFLIEAGVYNIIAILLAAALVVAVQPYFQEFTSIVFDFSTINAAWFWMLLTGFLLFVSFLSGLYPSTIISSFKPLSALKGQLRSPGGSFARRTLVVLQFTATMGLMINAYAIYKQVELMRSESLGMDITPILTINAPRVAEKSDSMTVANSYVDPFKTKALGIAGIQDVSISASIPGVWISRAKGIYRTGHEQEKDRVYHTLGVDDAFLNTYSMQVLAGRNFSDVTGSDASTIILTEEAMKQLGFANPEEALGDRITVGKEQKEVIGVVRNYHHMSLRENYQAIIIYPERSHKEYYSLQLMRGSGQDMASILSTLEKQWKTVYPSNPFEYNFLHESFQQQFSADVKFGMMFNVFTIIAIALACLGLFGLTSLITLRRTKEIGIRKVLGSATSQITMMLFKDMFIMLLTAGVFAVPIAYFSLTTWLSQFAFRIELTWWIFAIPLLSVALIAIISISFQVIKAAMANPVKSLKYE